MSAPRNAKNGGTGGSGAKKQKKSEVPVATQQESIVTVEAWAVESAESGARPPAGENASWYESRASRGWPVALLQRVKGALSRPLREDLAVSYLQTRRAFPTGLCNLMLATCKKAPIRFVVVDDSGSMNTDDGHHIVGTGKDTKLVKCTRWTELVHTCRFMAEFAKESLAITEFRLLNGADPCIVGLDPTDDTESMRFITDAFEQTPAGQTPLCAQIHEIVAIISQLSDELRAKKAKACIIIATDGKSTDGDVVDAMKPLQNLPCFVVIRLCTDDNSVIEYWNKIESDLELDFDAIDDLAGEAKEVRKFNSWLTYGEPLHRVREFGCHIKEFDLLDEVPLGSEQMRTLCAHLFKTGKEADLPHPSNWTHFSNAIAQSNISEEPIFDLNRKEIVRWVDARKLKNLYSSGELVESSACLLQ